MQRREVLKAGLTTALAGAGLGAVAGVAQGAAAQAGAQGGQPDANASAGAVKAPRTLRKAVMIGMVGEGATLADKFMLLRDCGFAGVEMDSPGMPPADEVRAAMDKSGLAVHGLVNSAHWKYHLNSPDDAVVGKAVEALETCLRDAKAVGASSVLLVPAVVNGRQPYDRAWQRSMRAIRSVLPLARETGVKIAIENVWNGFLLSPLEAARYVDEFADPMVRFHFDIGNVINFGWPDQWVRILGGWIEKLHIKDFSRKRRDEAGLWKGFEADIGDGDAGWAEVMAALDETGYATAPEGRWATAEVRGGDRTRLAEISKRMDDVLRR